MSPHGAVLAIPDASADCFQLHTWSAPYNYLGTAGCKLLQLYIHCSLFVVLVLYTSSPSHPLADKPTLARCICKSQRCMQLHMHAYTHKLMHTDCEQC